MMKPARSRSKLYRDPEVEAFVKECLLVKRMIYTDIHNACVERFGAARAPSRSAVGRYFQCLPEGEA